MLEEYTILYGHLRPSTIRFDADEFSLKKVNNIVKISCFHMKEFQNVTRDDFCEHINKIGQEVKFPEF